MDPSDNEKRDMMRALAQHLAHALKQEKPQEPIGVFPIPDQYIEEILTIVSTDTDRRRKLKNKLWRRVHEIMPATKDYNCSLDLSNATRPMVKLVAYQPGCPIKVGEDDVVEVHMIPNEHLNEIEDLADTDSKENTALSRYKLWKRINDILPDVARCDNDKISWKIHLNAETSCVFRYNDDREEKEREDAINGGFPPSC